MNTFTLLSASDWVAVYIDGELLRQGHPWSFTPKQWIQIGINGTQDSIAKVLHPDLEWLEKAGSFPNSLEEVILENRGEEE